jgi:hypothetical protein
VVIEAFDPVAVLIPPGHIGRGLPETRQAAWASGRDASTHASQLHRTPRTPRQLP